MTRREFTGLLCCAAAAQPVKGAVLVHEHILVDFIGADKIGPGRYDADEVFRAALPKLEEIKKLGCTRLQECTPNYLGRDPKLLARLQDATGIALWTNTGLYAAGNHKYLPDFARTETAAQLAGRWIAEAKQGVDGVKPRFIKIGVNRGPLHELDARIVRAAAITSRETGLPIAAHTGDGRAALEELDIIGSERVRASRFVWVHAQSEKDHAIHEKVARAGAWVEFDGINEKSAAWHLECVNFMAGKSLLERTLVSQDSGWYRVGEPGGGDYRGYTYLFTDFLPKLEARQVHQLVVTNPVTAFGR